MQHWVRFFVMGLFISQTAWAQGIKFETGTWPDVMQKASRENKLIFVHFDANPAACQQCIDVASQGFNNPVLREKFGINFLSYRLPFDHPDHRPMAGQYEIRGTPTSIYLDPAGNLLVRQPGSTSFALTYLENAEKAIQARSQPTLPALTAAYAANPTDKGALETLINKRQELGYQYDELLDTYADLTGDRLASAAAMAFVFERAPVVQTKAFTAVFRRPLPSVDSMYQRVGEKRAIVIDQQIILKSRLEAIRRRNKELAVETARFAVRAHGRREQTGQAGYSWNMMEYYRAVRDTARFLVTAATYYDTVYMTQPVDSVLKADQTALAMLRTNAIVPTGQPPAGSSAGGVSSFGFSPPSQEVANNLNRGAYSVYQLGRTAADWAKALAWSERALELLRENSPFLDTQAHLLYRLNRRDEAIRTQQRAIAAAPAMRMSSVQLEVELAKMQQGTL